MGTWSQFLVLFAFLSYADYSYSETVANLRQLTFKFSAYGPRFSPDGKRIAFGTLGDLQQVYTVSTEIPYARPHRISNGLSRAIPLNYRPDGDFVYATDAFQYTNMTEAFEATLHKKLKRKYFDIVVTNFLGNFKHRYGTLFPTVILAASKHAKFVAVLDNGLQIIEIFSGNRSQVLTTQSVTSAAFSPNHDRLYFTQTIEGGGTEFLMVFTNGTGLQSIFKAPKEHYALSDVTPDGDHVVLTHCKQTGKLRFDTDSCYLAVYNRATQAFRWVLLAGNRLQGTSAFFNDDGSKMAFVRLDEEFTDVFVVDWLGNGGRRAKVRNTSPMKAGDVKTRVKQARYTGMAGMPVSNSSSLVFEGERHLQNIRQITFTGQNAEGYWAFRGNSIVYQAAGGDYGTHCDQIYRLYWDADKDLTPQRLSTGLGSCTCSYFFPDDRRAIYASTFLESDPLKINDPKVGTCSEKKCQSQAETDPVLKQLCNTSYTWDLHKAYDIFLVDEYGNFIERLTNSSGYDAEGAISPDGKLMVFTSLRSGDPELWLYDFETKKFTQLTSALGYDGGPFFSPDGSKIGFRASRPQTPAEIAKYKQLLSYDLVEPLAMDLYTVNIDGSGLRRIAKLGNSSWAPFYLNDNRRIIFSSNHDQSAFGVFNLFVINDDGTGLEKVTNSNGFEAFPMMSPDGRSLIWGSSRNGKSPTDLNLFIAEWVD